MSRRQLFEEIEKASLKPLPLRGYELKEKRKISPFSNCGWIEEKRDIITTGSTVISSQFPVKSWHEIIGEPTIADAICDLVIHTAFPIELKGESVKKIRRKIDIKLLLLVE